MNEEREELYLNLETEIGNTPLYELSRIELPNGNRVFVKEENKNPGGSHYDRVFIGLFRHYEEKGKIIPGHTPVVETSSGSAGVSFARLGRLLGYECLVICPEDLPEERLDAIQRQGATLRLTPKEKYVDGSAEELMHVFTVENKERKMQGKVPYFGINHTQGDAAALAAISVEAVVDEAVAQASQKYGIQFDLVIAAGGNGTTALGFGRAAKRHKIPFVIWESLRSGVYFNARYPPEQGNGFEWKYGLRPGWHEHLSHPLMHKVFGTVYGPTPYPLPNIDAAFSEQLIGTVHILADEDTKSAAIGQVTSDSHLANISRLASWEPALLLLRDIEGKPVGRSSAGNVAMALDKQWPLKGKNILTFFYDDLNRY